MFELGTTEHWWEIAKRYSILSNHPNTLKPLGYAHMIMLIETFKPKTILEIGHGGGSLVFRTFANSNIELWGLDEYSEESRVSNESLTKIKEWNPHTKFVSGLLGTNVNELPDNYFDLVYSVSVIEHIPEENLSSVFEETYRVLKPGGIVSHSYDIHYKQNTKAVFDAFENAKLEWLKSKNTMNVFWEEWLGKFDFERVERLFEIIVFENPMVVAEMYMWQQERKNRVAPKNYLTVLTAARKPLNELDLRIDNEDSVNYLNLNSSKFITPDTFNDFTYSKKWHFELFIKNNYDQEIFGNKVDLNYCDLKTYQNLLIYSFIKQNVEKGSKILDIGGGDLLLLDYLRKDYECWNVDKAKDGGGTFFTTNSGLNLVDDYIGNFNKELPNNYFDLVFSCSALGYEELANREKFEDILMDIKRILKSGAWSIHCIALSLREPAIWMPEIIPYLFEKEEIINEFAPLFKVSIDPELFAMTKKYYTENWESSIGKTYENFGKLFSYNFLWKKN